MLRRSTTHSSNSDAREHISLRVKTADMVPKRRSRMVHIYSKNNEGKEYDGFQIFPERDDSNRDGTAGSAVVDEASSPYSATETQQQSYSVLQQASSQQTATSAASQWIWDENAQRYRYWDGSKWVWQKNPVRFVTINLVFFC